MNRSKHVERVPDPDGVGGGAQIQLVQRANIEGINNRWRWCEAGFGRRELGRVMKKHNRQQKGEAMNQTRGPGRSGFGCGARWSRIYYHLQKQYMEKRSSRGVQIT